MALHPQQPRQQRHPQMEQALPSQPPPSQQLPSQLLPSQPLPPQHPPPARLRRLLLHLPLSQWRLQQHMESLAGPLR